MTFLIELKVEPKNNRYTVDIASVPGAVASADTAEKAFEEAWKTAKAKVAEAEGDGQ